MNLADVSGTSRPPARQRPDGRVAPGGAAELLERRRLLSAATAIPLASPIRAAGAVMAAPSAPTTNPVRRDVAARAPVKKIAVTTVAKARKITAAVVIAPVATPAVRSFQVDDGTGQRSVVRSLTLAFNEPVALDAGAVALIRNSDTASTPVSISVATTDGGTTYRLTPTSGTTGGSLDDGAYAVVVHPAGVHSQASPTRTMTGGDRAYPFYREFGDIDGNGVVSFSDFLQLQSAFGTKTGSPNFIPGFDYNGNGTIDFSDFLQLQSRFGTAVRLPATTSFDNAAGTDFSYYEGAFTTLPDFSKLTPVKTGLTHNFDPSIRNRDSGYAFDWAGNVTVPASGVYTFYAGSDGASAVDVDGNRVVSNDGQHAYAEKAGNITLSAGKHTLRVEYAQGGTGEQLAVSYQGPGLAKQAIPDVALTGITPDAVDVDNYGAVGDGQTDDTAAIQAAINSAPDGATLVLDAGKTYRLNTGLLMARPLNVQGNGATLLLNTSAYPQNETVYYASPLAATGTTWTQTVTAGQTTFNVSVPANTLSPGDTVYLQLGTDPNDSTQPNWGQVCQVTADTGTSVTVDVAVPYNITQGSRPNRIQRLTDVVQDVAFEDVNFNYVSGTTPDINLWMERARNTTISGLTGDFTIMANVDDSQNVTVTDCSGTLHQLTSSSGRLVSAWQTDGLTVTNSTATTAADSPVVFLESWARNTTISGLTINWNDTAVSAQDVFHFTGNSYNTTADGITINNAGAINLVESGSQAASYQFGSVAVSGTIKSAPLTAIAKLTTGGQTYDASKLKTTTFSVTLASHWTDHQVALCSGVVASMSFTLSNLSGVTGLFANNSDDDGIQLIGKLTAGKTTVLPQFFGTDNPFDTPTAPDKRLDFYTGTVKAGTTLTVSVTYYA